MSITENAKQINYVEDKSQTRRIQQQYNDTYNVQWSECINRLWNHGWISSDRIK